MIVISIRVEQEAGIGPILRILSDHGINAHIEFDDVAADLGPAPVLPEPNKKKPTKSKPNRKRGGGRPPAGKKPAMDIVAELIAGWKQPTIRYGDISSAMKKAGYSYAAGHVPINTFQEDGLLKKVSKGQYKIMKKR